MTILSPPPISKARQLIAFCSIYEPSAHLRTLSFDALACDLIDLLLYFRSPEGFIAVFEEQLILLPKTRKKAGLDTAAYEAAEQMYCRLFNKGRRYVDRESFFNQLSKYRTKLKRNDETGQ